MDEIHPHLLRVDVIVDNPFLSISRHNLESWLPHFGSRYLGAFAPLALVRVTSNTRQKAKIERAKILQLSFALEGECQRVQIDYHYMKSLHGLLHDILWIMIHDRLKFVLGQSLVDSNRPCQ